MYNRAVLKRKIISTFGKSGLRNSSKRNAVIDAFVSSNTHLNTEELYSIVKSKAGIGLVTVYRTMRLLVQYGFAQEVDFQDGFTRYEINDDLSGQHEHLICIRCGHITEFKDGAIQNIERRARTKTGFSPLHHRLEIFGVCKLCREKEGHEAE